MDCLEQYEPIAVANTFRYEGQQIIAITHSPFVFDNALEPFATPLRLRVDLTAAPIPVDDEEDAVDIFNMVHIGDGKTAAAQADRIDTSIRKRFARCSDEWRHIFAY